MTACENCGETIVAQDSDYFPWTHLFGWGLTPDGRTCPKPVPSTSGYTRQHLQEPVVSDSDHIEPGQTWRGRYETVTATVTVVEPKRIGFVLSYARGATSYLSRRQFLKAYLPPQPAA